MNDRTWFRWYQPQLLGLANTSEGRDLLGIDHGVPTVVEIAPWYVTWLIGEGEYQSEFHSRAVFFRRVMHRWNETVSAMEHPLFTRLEPLFYRGKQLPVIAGGATLTVRPDAHVESSTVDGEIGFQGLPDGGLSRQTFANAHDDDGSTTNRLNDTYDNIGLGMGYRLGAGAGWEDFERGFHLYDTSSIGSNVVSAAVNSFTASAAGTSLSELTWCIVSSAPASNTALAAGDYDSLGTTDFGNFESDGLTIDSSTYNDITLNSDGRAAIDRSGITQFGIRHEGDRSDTDTKPTSGSGFYAGGITFRSADESGTSIDPKLVVTHAVATSDIEAVNGIVLGDIEGINDVTAANGETINGVTF